MTAHRMTMRTVGLGLVLALACATWASPPGSRMFRNEGHGARAAYMSPDDDLRRITAFDDVVTPHIEWARPLAGGPVRVLAIAPQTLGRWPVELSQRFGFEVNTVLCYAENTLGAPLAQVLFVQRANDVEARILQALNESVDVVVSSVPPSVLGVKVTERLAQVMGRGVGYVGPVEGLDLADCAALDARASEAMFAAAVPFAGLRGLTGAYDNAQAAAADIVKLWDGPKGNRIADLSAYPRDTSPPPANQLQFAWLPSVEHEAWCSLMGRAVLWTAGRVEPGSAIPATGASVHRRVWDADGRLRGEGTGEPDLPAGVYFTGLQQMDNREVVDWRFEVREVEGTDWIASVSVDGVFKKPTDQVTVTVALSEQAPAGARLEYTVVDNFGRVVFESLQDAGQTSCSAPVAESLHLYNYANVRLLDAQGVVLDEDRAAFYVAQPNPAVDDITLMVWEGGASFNPTVRPMMRRFADLGFHAALGGDSVEQAQVCAMSNVHLVPYVTRLQAAAADENGVRSPCLTNPAHMDGPRNERIAEAKELKGYAPFAYSLGDDQHYIPGGVEACWSPTCCAAFAEWGLDRYGTLEAINEAWGTAYASQDDVTPIRKEDALAAAPADLGPLCHWVDHKLFLDTTIMEWHKDLSRAIEAADPNAVAWYDCTVEGWMRPGSGFDFWKLASNTRFCVQYPNPIVHDIFRAAAPKDAYHGTWYGGYGIYNQYPYYDADFQPWWCVLHDINLHGLYYGGCGQNYHDERLIGPDLGNMPMFDRIMDEIDELRGGIAKLLFNAERQTDGVAMVFSRESNHQCVLFREDLPRASEWDGQYTGSPNYIYMQNWEGVSFLMNDLGLAYDVVPENALDDGALEDESLKLLVLPFTLRLTESEAAAVRAFVEAGGTVIADSFPGRFDGKARLSDGGMLADVFGATQDATVPGANVVRRTAALIDGRELGHVVVDSGIEATTAQPLGLADDGTPILLVNSFGKGKAILLNLLARDYQIWRTLGSEMPFRDAVGDALAEHAGIRSPVDFQIETASEGRTSHRVQGCEVHRYKLGDAEYVALLREYKLRPDDMIFFADTRPKPGWATFPEEAHVYDVRAGMYRGYGRRFEDVLYPARTVLYAMLPYEVRGLEVAAEASEGGFQVRGKVVPGGDAKATTHVVHITVTDPDGRVCRELSRNVVAEGGVFDETVFVGLGRPGAWTVRVKDVATGMTREVTVEVGEKG
ncbi:MAG: hypothetical protein GY851_15210 [bacterium]|nr:hypothetical protein [bacterium]